MWIAGRASSHLQAVGRDARGRKQYRYHPAFRADPKAEKFGALRAFGAVLPGIREHVARDLRARGLPQRRVVAAVVRLLETTLIRVGNDEYERANHSHGLTTLGCEHIAVRGERLTFCFAGEAQHTIGVRDRGVATVVRHCMALPGDRLFQWTNGGTNGDGETHHVTAEDVNHYLHEAGCEASAKAFRTWRATVLAAGLLAEAGTAETGPGRERAIRAVIKQVAAALGNTPAVCRASYVHPAILDAYRSRALARAARELDGEALTLRVLRAAARG